MVTFPTDKENYMYFLRKWCLVKWHEEIHLLLKIICYFLVFRHQKSSRNKVYSMKISWSCFLLVKTNYTLFFQIIAPKVCAFFFFFSNSAEKFCLIITWLFVRDKYLLIWTALLISIPLLVDILSKDLHRHSKIKLILVCK